MKIAVVTDDEQTVSQHFGRAQYYLVFTVEDGEITARERRDKLGHRQFAQMPDLDHDHDHDHEHGHEHGQQDPRGRGFGQSAERKHAMMIEAIRDCDAILVRGMGRGAYLAMEAANITPVVTDIASAEDAVKAYIGGDIVDHTDRLH
jgi:predicted Fe-Mo cluster-binding NifX family protein